MKRYFSTKTGEEVKLGDILIISYTENIPMGRRTVKEVIKITEDNIDDLVEVGFLKVKEVEEDSEVKMALSYYIDLMATEQGWSYEKMCGFLNKVFEINKSAALAMILKAIAVELDTPYKGHISQSDEIWVISITSGETIKYPKDKIASYKNFAAFRNSTDAALAWTIVKPLIMNMFTDEEEYKDFKFQ